MWYVYVVRCSDRSLYTGITTDVKRRVGEHNEGRGARYTRSRGPVKLIYRERAADRGAALRREYEIKRMTVKEKLVLVAKRRVRRSANSRTNRRQVNA